MDKDLNELITEGVAASALAAAVEAMRWNQPLIIWREGRIVHIPPEELIQMQSSEMKQ